MDNPKGLNHFWDWDNTVVSRFLYGCFLTMEVVVPMSVTHLHSFENVTWDLLSTAQLQRILHLLI